MAESEADVADNDLGAGAAADRPQFAIQQLYIKDLSFESPNSPDIFTVEQWEPEIDLRIDSNANLLREGIYEVVLTVTVTAEAAGKSAFLIEVQQAGIFVVSNFSDEEMGPILGSTCPGVLYPYAREVISSLSLKGGFPPFVLVAANFDAIYRAKMRESQENESGE
ncbi:MAG: protein-export chaperone SecB [Pseudomonadota bacterium]